MNDDYRMSDDLFRLRACEEDGCMISAFGAGLAGAMSPAGVIEGQPGLVPTEPIRALGATAGERK